ncbi:hypothetical protein D7V80_12470 [Corallococcus sp. CA054B]|uniref:hypothetical protein n=1 Tax=Corallococcus sp. CA054B TaxID=2316734 RepID=UPI000EA4068F|nr:hypothetical protein [Corallococcus sp. CA054B]RKG68437.1 hypothetical protein D7V80_12470 [Corallococcus sp. CA054B]
MPEQVMQALLDLLAEMPDYRVGQALAIAAARGTGYSDPFNVEDEALFKALQQMTTEARDRKRARPASEDSLEAYLTAKHEGSMSEWLQGLSRWGHRPLALAAFAVAEPCLGIWEHGVPEDGDWQFTFARASSPRDALTALRRWLGESQTPLAPHVEALRKLIRSAELTEDEAGGGADLIRKRQRCVAAGRAIVLALEAAVWTPEQATRDIADEAERQAVMAAGPFLEPLGAARAFLSSVPGSTEENVREHVRRILLAQ